MSAPEAAPLHADPPAGYCARYLKTSDGRALRAAWAGEGTVARGTILLCHGRSEFIEKYYPILDRLGRLDFAVVTFDWRGQGMSERLLDVRLPGYVRHFDDYQRDLDTVLGFMDERRFPGPFVMIGHSMGGCIGLRRLCDDPQGFAGAAFTAPMIDLALPPTLRIAAPWIAASLVRTGWGKRYINAVEDTSAATCPFEGNVLTRDRAGFERYVGLVRDYPDLGLGGATWRWLAAAFRDMNRLARIPDNTLETPTLIAMAEEDTVVSNEAAQRFAERQQAAELVTLPGARHEPFFETPDIRALLWQHVEAFLDRIAPSAAPHQTIRAGGHNA